MSAEENLVEEDDSKTKATESTFELANLNEQVLHSLIALLMKVNTKRRIKLHKKIYFYI